MLFSQLPVINIFISKEGPSMTSPNAQQPSLQNSQVSSSSSNGSQSYELLPRQQPITHLSRDAASPRASFPFKRVQGGFESMSIKNQSESQISMRESNKKIEEQSKQLIEAIGEMNTSNKIIKNIENESYQMGKQIQHEECNSQIRQLQLKILSLQQKLGMERNDFELQKKANEIYSEGFGQIRQLVSKQVSLQGESIEELVQKLNELLRVRGSGEEAQRANGDSQLLIEQIEQQDKKIRELRAQLVRSSQNNINAIFNTEITEAHCLHLQIKKLNGQILGLKENLFKLNQENGLRAGQSNAHTSQKQTKVINVYHHGLDSSGDEDVIRKEVSRGRRKKSQMNLNKSVHSSDSQGKKKKSRRLSSTQVKVGELVQGYKSLRQEYKSLQLTIKQMNSNQVQYKTFFNGLKTQISTSLSNQIREVKETLRRPSSSSSEKKFARDLEGKLNHLINTLNAPEKASAERSMEEEGPSNWRRVESMKRIQELQGSNAQLEEQIKVLEQEREALQEKVMQMSQFQSPRSRRTGRAELQLQSIESMPRRGGRRELGDVLGRSQLKEQEIVEQLSLLQGAPVVHSSSINKLQSSQSYHQSNSRPQLEQMQRKVDYYRQSLREKELRITQLENTILDHFQSRAVLDPAPSTEQLREKYEVYISNLKILLGEAKRENEVLRKEFIQSNEAGLSRARPQHDCHSITLSDRTTKNPIAQTRMIQRRGRANNYQSAQAKLYLEDQIEQIFLALLELYEKTGQLLEEDRVALASSVLGCLRWLVTDARAQGSRLQAETLQREEVRRSLAELGLQEL